MSKNDGGQAFPRAVLRDGCEGMSLRDWFAGRATWGDIKELVLNGVSRKAAKYQYADAMLAEREKE